MIDLFDRYRLNQQLVDLFFSLETSNKKRDVDQLTKRGTSSLLSNFASGMHSPTVHSNLAEGEAYFEFPPDPNDTIKSTRTYGMKQNDFFFIFSQIPPPLTSSTPRVDSRGDLGLTTAAD